jgi:XTP/dITP diphosphohydrolase
MPARKLFPGPLVIASHNEGKVREIAALLGPLGMEPISAGALGLDEPEETEDSFVGNATLKALASTRGSGMPALADDSGLEVAALGGRPGVYTANWAEQPDGTRDWGLAMEKVEAELQALGPDTPRDAAFVCTLALAWPDGHVECFSGRIEGHLTWPPRGKMGFGYDPVFVPGGSELTFAEIEPSEKHAISHRARAFEKLVAACF